MATRKDSTPKALPLGERSEEQTDPGQPGSEVSDHSSEDLDPVAAHGRRVELRAERRATLDQALEHLAGVHAALLYCRQGSFMNKYEFHRRRTVQDGPASAVDFVAFGREWVTSGMVPCALAIRAMEAALDVDFEPALRDPPRLGLHDFRRDAYLTMIGVFVPLYKNPESDAQVERTRKTVEELLRADSESIQLFLDWFEMPEHRILQMHTGLSRLPGTDSDSIRELIRSNWSLINSAAAPTTQDAEAQNTISEVGGSSGATASAPERALLKALLDAGAETQETCVTAQVLTKAVHHDDASVEYQRQILTEMRKRGWVGSKPARGGGYWLLNAGHAALNRSSGETP